jgi:SAM-dependent methyltransferase
VITSVDADDGDGVTAAGFPSVAASIDEAGETEESQSFAGRKATLASSADEGSAEVPFDEAAEARRRRSTPVRGTRTRSTPVIGVHAVKPGRAWFESVFDENYLRTVRFATAERTAREVSFIEQTLEPAKDSEIIDLGCGTGRHCLELAGRGYTAVTGFDLSLPLLIRGADDAQRRGRKVNFVHGDLREMDFDEQYDVAFAINTTFGFFDDDSNRQVLQSICAALKIGGRLLIDVVNRDYVVRDLPKRVGWEGDGCLVLEEVAFNFFTSRLNSKRSIVFMDGRHVEQEISIRCYSLHELGKLLHHSGFRVLEVSGDTVHRARFFGRESPSLLVVAEKR